MFCRMDGNFGDKSSVSATSATVMATTESNNSYEMIVKILTEEGTGRSTDTTTQP